MEWIQFCTCRVWSCLVRASVGCHVYICNFSSVHLSGDDGALLLSRDSMSHLFVESCGHATDNDVDNATAVTQRRSTSNSDSIRNINVINRICNSISFIFAPAAPLGSARGAGAWSGSLVVESRTSSCGGMDECARSVGRAYVGDVGHACCVVASVVSCSVQSLSCLVRSVSLSGRSVLIVNHSGLAGQSQDRVFGPFGAMRTFARCIGPSWSGRF